ncbi:MAG TPA: fasciclin domain-containing protein [Rubricoccaceae bacterium]|nr:fasciclin domain-containing protein [Rubricoccaceae bacterium]
MRLPVFLALALSSALLACGDDAPGDAAVEAPPAGVEPVATDDLVTAATDAGLTRLVALADTAGLLPTLRGEGPYTVFAPTNEAFQALPQSLRDSLALPANRARLERILRYHVVPGRIETNMLPMTVGTLEGGELTFEASPDGHVVRDAQGNAVRVVTPDVNVMNGVVHVLDGVLMPADTTDGR